MNFPVFNGNWVDLVILIIVIFYLFGGWNRGLIIGLVDLGGFLFSFFAALKFYSFFGRILAVNFSLPYGISDAIGFFLAGMLAELIFALLANLFLKNIYRNIIQQAQDNKEKTYFLKFDRALGFIPSLGEAIIFIAFILTLLIALPIQGGIKQDILSSKIANPLIGKTQGIERQLNIIFGQAVNETLTFLTINPSPESGEKIDLRFTQTNVKVDQNAENTMLALVNQERVKAGLNTLKLSPVLTELARDYARDMFARGYFSHYNPEGQSPFDRMAKRGIKYLAAGENLALAPNVNLAHQGLINSPGHRANILSPDFNKVGIGVIDGGIYGEMFVQEFTD